MCEEPTDGRKDAAGSRTDDRRSSVEERYRKIFEHNNDAVVVVDFETESFVDVNPPRANYWNTPARNSFRWIPKPSIRTISTGLAAFAENCGGLGLAVDDPAGLDDALQKAITHDGLALVETITDADPV